MLKSLQRVLGSLIGWTTRRGFGLLVSGATILLLVEAVRNIVKADTTMMEHLALYPRRQLAAICMLVAAIALIIYYAVRCHRRGNRILACAILVIAVVAEYALHIPTSSVPYRTHFGEPTPYMAFAGIPGLHVQNDILRRKMGGGPNDNVIELNELGYRGPVPPARTDDEYRILVLGGSTIFNGMPLSASIPQQLERLFHEAGHSNVRVYNWGVVSAVSGQELAQMVHRAPATAPDLVVVYDGWNDLLAPWRYDPRPGYPYNAMISEHAIRRSTFRTGPAEVARYILAHSQLVDAATGGRLRNGSMYRDHLRETNGYGSDEWEWRIAEAYGRNVNAMAAVGEGFQFKVAVFLQPLLAFKSRAGSECALPADEDWEAYAHRVMPRLAHCALASTSGRSTDTFRFADLSQILTESSEDLFWDPGHVNNRGNELIAQEIFKHVYPFAMPTQEWAGTADQTKEDTSG